MNGWSLTGYQKKATHQTRAEKKKCWSKTESGGSQVGGLYPRPEDGSEHQAGAATESMEFGGFLFKKSIKTCC